VRDAARGAGRERLLIEPNYRGYRIAVTAVRVDDAWDANIRVRRTLSDMQPHIEVVTCRKPTAKAAEEHAAVYARRWVDRHRAG
jgi:hypothetical protein